jgi:hypothetical protein
LGLATVIASHLHLLKGGKKVRLNVLLVVFSSYFRMSEHPLPSLPEVLQTVMLANEHQGVEVPVVPGARVHRPGNLQVKKCKANSMDSIRFHF